MTNAKRRARSPSSDVEEGAPSSAPFKVLEVPKEVLALIVEFAALDDEASLVDLALVSKVFASVALQLLQRDITAGSFDRIIRIARYKKTKKGKGAGETETLTLALDTIYPKASTSLASLRSLLTCVAPHLTSLSLTTPSSAHNPVLHLFPKLTALDQLGQLTHFELGAEIWFHDLLTLLSSWPLLVSLVVSNLRGDCHSPFPTTTEGLPKLQKISIGQTTLTGTMISFLLKGQTELSVLEMPLPGGKEDAEGKLAWNAIERLVGCDGQDEGEGGELQVLNVWDRWGDQTAAKKRKESKKKGASGNKGDDFVTTKKGDAKAKSKSREREEEESEGEGETDELDSDCEAEAEQKPNEEVAAGDDEAAETEDDIASPLLSIMSSSKCSIRSLSLTTAYLPSSPSPTSFLQLLPHLSHLTQLTIEDNKASGLRGMVETALRKRALPALKELASVGVKKRGGGGAGGAKGKIVNRKKKSQGEDTGTEDDYVDGSDRSNGKKTQKGERNEQTTVTMSKAELKFFEFCRKKGIEWKSFGVGNHGPL